MTTKTDKLIDKASQTAGDAKLGPVNETLPDDTPVNVSHPGNKPPEPA